MELKWIARNNGIAKWNFNGLQEIMELPNGIKMDSTKQWNSKMESKRNSDISEHRCAEMTEF